MRTSRIRIKLVSICLLSLLVMLLVTSMAGAVEDSLLGVRIGSSYRDLVDRFDQPTGILFSAGGGMMYQSLPSVSQSRGGLPQFSVQPTVTTEPIWILPIRVGILSDRQAQWVYDLRRSRGVALGVILSGEGADAVVTDVIVAGYPQNLKKKPFPVRTERGITLQSTFSEVIKKYGYPPLIEIFAPSGGTQPTGGGAMRAGGTGRTGSMSAGGGARVGMMGRGGGGGMRGGAMRGGGGAMGMRGGGAMRRGAAAEPATKLVQHLESPQIVLTGMGMMGGMRGGGGSGMGGGATTGGGMGGGGMRRGAMGGGMRGGGMGGGMSSQMRSGMGGARAPTGGGRAGALPPLTAGALGRATADRFTAQAIVDNQAISFSRDCIITYEGIAFTLHDMRVMRIHISE